MERLMSEKPAVFIFSYNRGGHLELCVQSALAHAADCRIVVIDDASTDPSTVRVLDSLPATVECVRRERTSQLRHGGLYDNMQMALDMAGTAPFMMFVQDDVQFVRNLDPEDYAEIDALCAMEPTAFVNTTFLRQSALDSLRLNISDNGLYYESHNDSIYTARSYVDVMAVSPTKLRSLGWNFEEGEQANAKRADRELAPLRYMLNPIMMNAPRPIAYRGRSRSIFIRVMESLYRYGVYSFVSLTQPEVSAMRKRNKCILPLAEEFLTIENANLSKPWDYDIFESNRFIYPAFHLSKHPVKYLRYQILKRIGRNTSEELFH
jgi:glycosyltransferase involved in cell wall biosynthesis